jgi:putative ABC transport system ATP-binding protein
MELFDQLHREGHTLIIVTHEDEIAAHCQRVVEMKDGKIFKDSHSGNPTKARETV